MTKIEVLIQGLKKFSAGLACHLVAGVALNGMHLGGCHLFDNAGVRTVVQRGPEEDLISRLRVLGMELAFVL